MDLKAEARRLARVIAKELGFGVLPPTWKLDAVESALLAFGRLVREEDAKARDQVPVLPGHMPDEMWNVVSTDRDAAEEGLRIIVRQTLDEYEAAIRAKSLE